MNTFKPKTHSFACRLLKFSLNSQKGDSLIEAVAAVAILVIVITGLTLLAISALGSASSSKWRTTATEYAKEGIEAVRMIRDNDANFANVSPYVWGQKNTSGTWAKWDWTTWVSPNTTRYYALESANSGWRLNYKTDANCAGDRTNPMQACYLLGTDYYRQIMIENRVAPYTEQKRIMVTISWQYKGRSDNVQMITYLSNWR